MSEITADRDKLSDQEAANPEKLALQSNKLQKLRKAYQKRGIVYVSRIPPHMVRHAAGMHLFDVFSDAHPDLCAPQLQKPQKLRQLLWQYGSIGRLYCTPEGRHPQNLHATTCTLPKATSLHLSVCTLQILLCASSGSRKAATQARTLQKAGLSLKTKRLQSRLLLC